MRVHLNTRNTETIQTYNTFSGINYKRRAHPLTGKKKTPMRKRARKEVVAEPEELVAADEQPSTTYVKCAAKLSELADVYKADVTTPAAACTVDKAALLEYMDAREWDFAKAAEKIYLRTKTVVATGRSLCAATFVDVVKDLKTVDVVLETAVSAVRADIATERDRWVAMHGADAPLPDTPQPRYTGRGYAQRPTPPLARPLTAAEELAEVLYAAVHAVHKPRKRQLDITKTAKRGATPNIVDDAVVATRAVDCFQTLAAVTKRRADIRVARAAVRQTMAACVPALEARIRATQRDIEEVTPDGTKTQYICLESKPERAKPLTLTEFSAILDGVVAAVVAVNPAARAPVAADSVDPLRALVRDYGDAIVDGVVDAIEARQQAAARTLGKPEIVLKKEGGGGSAGKPLLDDAFEGDDDYDEEDDNAYGL